MRVLILHGWGGSDYPHWQAKLASKLACNYKAVYFPLLKNPHFPSRNSWLKQLDEIMEWFKPTIVVCHSLGQKNGHNVLLMVATSIFQLPHVGFRAFSTA